MAFVPASVINVPFPTPLQKGTTLQERGVGLQVGLHASSSTRGAVSLPHLNSATSKKAAAVCKESVLKVNNALPVNNAV